jgi:hypothetical protein
MSGFGKSMKKLCGFEDTDSLEITKDNGILSTKEVSF